MNKKIVIADAGPLIAFARLNLLSLLPKILGSVIIPEIVADECLIDISRLDAIAIKKAIAKKILKTHSNPDISQYPDLHVLDAGEATAIALALKLHARLLIDEKIGRHIAEKYQVEIIGSMGVLLLAKKKKLINRISPLLNELNKLGYYLSPQLMQEILKRAKEKPG